MTSCLPEGLPQPLPAADGLDAPYWAGTREKRLMIQRCKQCRRWQWGPEWICHRCRSFDMGWEEIGGKGVIYSWERSWRVAHPALAAHGPYVTVIVELPQAGNVRMVGNLVGDPLAEVRIGDSVEAVFEPHDAAEVPYTLVQWRRP